MPRIFYFYIDRIFFILFFALHRMTVNHQLLHFVVVNYVRQDSRIINGIQLLFLRNVILCNRLRKRRQTLREDDAIKMNERCTVSVCETISYLCNKTRRTIARYNSHTVKIEKKCTRSVTQVTTALKMSRNYHILRNVEKHPTELHE